MPMDTLIVPFEVKADNTEKGVFSGYGSTFGNIDKGNDKCIKGCFASAIKAMGTKSIMPAMYFMHKKELPIGDWLEVKEDDNGLFVKGRLWIGTGIPEAERAYKMLQGTGPKGLSIGYNAKKSSRDQKSGVRSLEELELPEVSVVGYGMNELATVHAVKQLPDPSDIDAMNSVLARIKGVYGELLLQSVLEKMNPNHDELGRFASGDGGGSGGSSDFHSQSTDRTMTNSWSENAAAYSSAAVQAAGANASPSTVSANEASKRAFSASRTFHDSAENAHIEAAKLHKTASADNRRSSAKDYRTGFTVSQLHSAAATYHRNAAEDAAQRRNGVILQPISQS